MWMEAIGRLKPTVRVEQAQAEITTISSRRRVREIGMRMALGARTSDVLRMILAEGMTRPPRQPAWASAWRALSRSGLSTLVFGLRPSDPLTLAGVSLPLAGMAVLASLIPAYRATKVERIRALRDE